MKSVTKIKTYDQKQKNEKINYMTLAFGIFCPFKCNSWP